MRELTETEIEQVQGGNLAVWAFAADNGGSISSLDLPRATDPWATVPFGSMPITIPN